jgi:hypothetical protein
LTKGRVDLVGLDGLDHRLDHRLGDRGAAAGLRRQDDRRLAADVCEQVSGDVFGGEAVMDHCGDDATLQLVGRVLSVPQPDACALGWCEPQ